MPTESTRCRWVSLSEALQAFVQNVSGHQSAAHIKPLHWYVASRLVLEGGFHPDEITPRPPFVVENYRDRRRIRHDAEAGSGGELTVLGGLKTKAIDVVVAKPGVGPVIAVSLKGTLKAFRNLTNRMEEAVGDCTNLHISYPALVYGFLQVLRANRSGTAVSPNDVALDSSGRVVDAILRYHDVLARLAERNDLRNDVTRYEAVALALASCDADTLGEFVPSFPDPQSTLGFHGFFEKLYKAYDSRFVYAAPKLERITRRIEWDADSPILGDSRIVDFSVRIAPSR